MAEAFGTVNVSQVRMQTLALPPFGRTRPRDLSPPDSMLPAGQSLTASQALSVTRRLPGLAAAAAQEDQPNLPRMSPA